MEGWRREGAESTVLPAKRTKIMRDFWGRLETPGHSRDPNISFTVGTSSGPAGGEFVEGRSCVRVGKDDSLAGSKCYTKLLALCCTDTGICGVSAVIGGQLPTGAAASCK